MQDIVWSLKGVQRLIGLVFALSGRAGHKENKMPDKWPGNSQMKQLNQNSEKCILTKTGVSPERGSILQFFKKDFELTWNHFQVGALRSK